MGTKDDHAASSLASFHSFILIPAAAVSGRGSRSSTQVHDFPHNMPPTDQTVSAQFEKLPVPVKLLTAGASACFADFASFPLDTAKVRLQVQGEVKVKVPSAVPLTSATQNVILGVHQAPAPAAAPQLHYRGIFGTMATITREEGFRCLYNGLNAGLQRQMAFASIRLGMYEPVKARYQTLLKVTDQNRGGGADVVARIFAGLTTGGTAVMCAQPTDVVKIRFQAQAKAGQQSAAAGPRYTGTWQAYKTIYFKEGLAGLWKGTIPNIGRNAIVNVAEIVVYDLVKDTFLRHKVMGDNIACHFSSAVVAGLVATFVASPVDVIKTRYMNSAPGTYRGAFHCAVQTFGREGVSAFYKGFFPSFSRITMWNILMWVTYEQAKRAVIQNYPNKDE